MTVEYLDAKRVQGVEGAGSGTDGDWTSVTGITSASSTNPSGLGTKSFNCDGNSNYLTTTKTSMFPLDSSLSISMWINPDSFSGTDNCILIQKIGSDGGISFSLRDGDAKIKWQPEDASANTAGGEASFTFNTGRWYLMVGMR